MARAPWLPPNTSRVGRSGPSPSSARAVARAPGSGGRTGLPSANSCVAVPTLRRARASGNPRWIWRARPASTRAWASARAGMRWPPVPPPASKTFIGPAIADWGLRIADQKKRVRSPNPAARLDAGPTNSAIRNPQSAMSCPPTPSSAPNADEHSGPNEGHEQARPSVRDERQGNTGRREQGEAHTHVQRRGDSDQSGEPHREQLAERVARRPRDAEPEPHERPEQYEQRQDSQESPLFTDRREDEIGVGIRQVAEFLLALSEADAEQPSRPDADERLMHLPRRFGGGASGIEKRDHPGQPILRARDRAEQERRRRHREREKVADAGAGREQDDPGEQRHEQRHREVRLEKDQRQERCQHDDEGQQAVLERADALAFFRREHGGPDHHRELGKLGGLHRDEAEVDPAARAVDAGGDAVGEGQQRDEE